MEQEATNAGLKTLDTYHLLTKFISTKLELALINKQILSHKVVSNTMRLGFTYLTSAKQCVTAKFVGLTNMIRSTLDVPLTRILVLWMVSLQPLITVTSRRILKLTQTLISPLTIK